MADNMKIVDWSEFTFAILLFFAGGGLFLNAIITSITFDLDLLGLNILIGFAIGIAGFGVIVLGIVTLEKSIECTKVQR